MKFWKDPAHIRTLLFYLVASAAICAACFYIEMAWGITVAAACVMFTVFRLVNDMVYDARVRALNRRVEAALRGDRKISASNEKRGELYELDRNVYKLVLKLADSEEKLEHEQEENEALLRSMAQHLILRADELPANVHRRELIALAHDMENLAELHGEPVSPDLISPVSATDAWQDAMVLAGETLRLQQITVNTEAHGRAYVTTCPRTMVIGGLRGLLETCARHSDVGSSWMCSIKETVAFTEFRVSSDRFDWPMEEFSSLFGKCSDAEPALVYLTRLARAYSGEVRTERGDEQMRHLVFRLYKETR